MPCETRGVDTRPRVAPRRPWGRTHPLGTLVRELEPEPAPAPALPVGRSTSAGPARGQLRCTSIAPPDTSIFDAQKQCGHAITHASYVADASDCACHSLHPCGAPGPQPPRGKVTIPQLGPPWTSRPIKPRQLDHCLQVAPCTTSTVSAPSAASGRHSGRAQGHCARLSMRPRLLMLSERRSPCSRSYRDARLVSRAFTSPALATTTCVPDPPDTRAVCAGHDRNVANASKRE